MKVRSNVQPVIPGGGIGAAAGTTPGTDERTKALRWLLGLGGTWIILTLMVDLGDTSDLAVAFALVLMGSVLLEYGPEVFSALGISTAPPTQGGSDAGSS